MNVLLLILSVLNGSLSEKIDSLVKAGIKERAFPSAVVLVVKENKIVHFNAYGKLTYDEASPIATKETIYDLASLTKPLVTLYSVMKLYEEKKIFLDDYVIKYIPEFAMNGKDKIQIKHLLLHNSGLIAFRKYAETCHSYKDIVMNICQDKPIALLETQTIYSDLNFVLLTEIVSRIEGKPYDNIAFKKYFEKHFSEPMGLHSTFFPSDSILPNEIKNRIAPTQISSPFKAIVHDPTSAISNGVAGNAGLFSTAEEVYHLAEIMVNKGIFKGKKYFEPSTIALFTKKITNRSMGWEIKSASQAYPGNYFSTETFGHTGFTGTMLWIDPVSKVCIVFLTNRVYPNQDNNLIRKYRMMLNDVVMKSLK